MKRLLVMAALLCATLALAQNAPRRPGLPGRPANRPAFPPPQWADPQRLAPPPLTYDSFKSRTVRQDVGFLLYLPPSYSTQPNRRYPVVYWLHGMGGSPATGSRFASWVDDATRKGKCPEMIVVLVNGMRTSFYCDWADGSMPVETVTIRELIPHIDATCRTIASRDGRAIEGFSMGGYGALHLAFKYPDLFCAASCMAGALKADRIPEIYGRAFGGKDDIREANSPFTLVTKHLDSIRGQMKLRVVVGEDDNVFRSNLEMHQLLDRLKIEHFYRSFPGVDHEHPVLYDRLGNDGFAFYRDAFTKATRATQSGRP